MKRLLAACVGLMALSPVFAVDAAASFSGRNGRILFDGRSEDFSRPLGIRTMRADGSAIKRLTRRADSFASWSPDGTQIAFTRVDSDGVTRLMVMNADGSGKHRVGTPSLGYQRGCGLQPPRWSYDGLFIAYADDCFDQTPRVAQLRLATADGSGALDLTDYSALHHFSQQPWSPDLENSSELVYTSDADGGDGDIYVMKSDGSDVRQLTSDDLDQIEAIWSPSGDAIAFSTQTQRGREYFNSIYTIPPAGGTATMIVEGDPHADSAKWSPDGSRLLFARRTADGYPTAFVSAPDGTHELEIGRGVDVTGASWAPDGRALAVVRNGDIWKVRLGAALSWRRLTRGGAWELNPDWQAKPAA